MALLAKPVGYFRVAKQLLKRASIKKEKVNNPVLYGSLLAGRTVLVTGGSSGIGLAMAKAFVRNGAAVVIASRSRKRVDTALDEIAGQYENAVAVGVTFDASTDEEAAFCRMLIEAESSIGRPIDALVNGAGVIDGGNIPNTTMSGYDHTLDTNLRGAFFLSQAFSKRLISAKRKGNILNVCSSSSVRPAISPYTISKWGMRGLTLGLAKALIGHDIVVNGIAPGPTATPMLADSEDGNLNLPSVPAGRYATAEEIANMAVVLLSDISRMVVGDIVYMTGGCGNLTFDDMDYTIKP